MPSPNTLLLRNNSPKPNIKFATPTQWQRYRELNPKPMSRRDKIRAGLMTRKG